MSEVSEIVLELVLVNELVDVVMCKHGPNTDIHELHDRETHPYDRVIHAIGMVNKRFADLVPAILQHACCYGSRVYCWNTGKIMCYRDDNHAYYHGMYTGVGEYTDIHIHHNVKQFRYNKPNMCTDVIINGDAVSVVLLLLYGNKKYLIHTRAWFSQDDLLGRGDHLPITAHCVHCPNCVFGAAYAVLITDRIKIRVMHRHDNSAFSFDDYDNKCHTEYIIGDGTFRTRELPKKQPYIDIDTENVPLDMRDDVNAISHLCTLLANAASTHCTVDVSTLPPTKDCQDVYSCVIGWIARNMVTCDHTSPITYRAATQFGQCGDIYDQLKIGSIVNKRFSMEVQYLISRLKCPMIEAYVDINGGTEWIYGGLLHGYPHGEHVFTLLHNDEISLRMLSCVFVTPTRKCAIIQVGDEVVFHGEYHHPHITRPGRKIEHIHAFVFDITVDRDHPAVTEPVGNHTCVLERGMHCPGCVLTAFARVVGEHRWLVARKASSNKHMEWTICAERICDDFYQYDTHDGSIRMYDYDLFGEQTTHECTLSSERKIDRDAARSLKTLYDLFTDHTIDADCVLRDEPYVEELEEYADIEEPATESADIDESSEIAELVESAKPAEHAANQLDNPDASAE